MAEESTTPASLRAAAEEALREPGQQRMRLLSVLEELDAALRPLVLSARRNEVPYRRISELTGLSPMTVQAWVKRAEQERRDN